VIAPKRKSGAVVTGRKSDEKRSKAALMHHLLASAEADIAAGRIRSAKSFFKKFKNDHRTTR